MEGSLGRKGEGTDRELPEELSNDVLLTPVSSGMTGVLRDALPLSFLYLQSPVRAQAAGKARSVQLFPTLQNLAFFLFIYSGISFRAPPCWQRGVFVCLLSSNGQRISINSSSNN